MKVGFFDVELFQRFLEENGAGMVPKMSPYELLRYRSGETNRVGVVYRNDHNQNRALSGAAIDDYKAWAECAPGRVRKMGSNSRSSAHRRVAARDGEWCAICHLDPESAGPLTLEHFLSRAHGGPNCVENLVLACHPCNLELDSLPVAQKLRVYESKAHLRALTPRPAR